MNEKPISHDEIFNQLNKFQVMDCKYSDGRILRKSFGYGFTYI